MLYEKSVFVITDGEVSLTEFGKKLFKMKLAGIESAIKSDCRWDGALERARWLVSTLEMISELSHKSDNHKWDYINR